MSTALSAALFAAARWCLLLDVDCLYSSTLCRHTLLYIFLCSSCSIHCVTCSSGHSHALALQELYVANVTLQLPYPVW
ncbi:MAG: hypothetical protein ABSA11_07725 [Candidatus Bathyarchaeia archaeon]